MNAPRLRPRLATHRGKIQRAQRLARKSHQLRQGTLQMRIATGHRLNIDGDNGDGDEGAKPRNARSKKALHCFANSSFLVRGLLRGCCLRAHARRHDLHRDASMGGATPKHLQATNCNLLAYTKKEPCGAPPHARHDRRTHVQYEPNTTHIPSPIAIQSETRNCRITHKAI